MSKVKCIYSVVPSSPSAHLPALFLELVLLYFSVTALVLIPSQYHIHRTRRMLQEGEPFAWSHNISSQYKHSFSLHDGSGRLAGEKSCRTQGARQNEAVLKLFWAQIVAQGVVNPSAS